MSLNERSEKQKKVFTISLALVGVILFWRGVWDVSERFFSAEVSLIIGLALLVSAAIVDRKQIIKFLS